MDPNIIITGELTVTLSRGKDIDAKRIYGVLDTYCSLTVGSQTSTSYTSDRGAHPQWNQIFKFKDAKNSDELIVKVKGRKLVWSDDIGTCRMSLSRVIALQNEDAALAVVTSNGKSGGTLYLQVEFKETKRYSSIISILPAGVPPPTPQPAAADQRGGAGAMAAPTPSQQQLPRELSHQPSQQNRDLARRPSHDLAHQSSYQARDLTHRSSHDLGHQQSYQSRDQYPAAQGPGSRYVPPDGPIPPPGYVPPDGPIPPPGYKPRAAAPPATPTGPRLPVPPSPGVIPLDGPIPPPQWRAMNQQASIPKRQSDPNKPQYDVSAAGYGGQQYGAPTAVPPPPQQYNVQQYGTPGGHPAHNGPHGAAGQYAVPTAQQPRPAYAPPPAQYGVPHQQYQQQPAGYGQQPVPSPHYQQQPNQYQAQQQQQQQYAAQQQQQYAAQQQQQYAAQQQQQKQYQAPPPPQQQQVAAAYQAAQPAAQAVPPPAAHNNNNGYQQQQQPAAITTAAVTTAAVIVGSSASSDGGYASPVSPPAKSQPSSNGGASPTSEAEETPLLTAVIPSQDKPAGKPPAAPAPQQPSAPNPSPSPPGSGQGQKRHSVRIKVLPDAKPGCWDYYERGRYLSSGAFGMVYEAVNKRTGEKVAVKVINKNKLKDEQYIEDVRYEVKVMHHLKDHPNVVQLKDMYEDMFHVYLVLELCAGGPLSNALRTEADAAKLMRTIIKAVAHLHQLGVIHRDIKPENFLLSSAGSEGVVKVADYGFAVFFKEEELLNDQVGSPQFMAPEVWQARYNKEADIWSCGVLLYLMLSGDFPFGQDLDASGDFFMQLKSEVLYKEIDVSSGVWREVSGEAKSLVLRMLTRNRKQRPSAKELLRDPWLRSDGVASSRNPIQLEVVKRFAKFGAMNHLAKAVYKVMAGNRSDYEVEGLRELFKEIDKDGNGYLTESEMKQAFRLKGESVPPEQLRLIMERASDKGVSWEDFSTAMLNRSVMEDVERLRQAFDTFDTDGNGTISLEELKQALCDPYTAEKDRMTEAQVTQMMRDADKDGDNELSFEEFCTVVATRTFQ